MQKISLTEDIAKLWLHGGDLMKFIVLEAELEQYG